MTLERSNAMGTNFVEASGDGRPGEITHLLRSEETTNSRLGVTDVRTQKAQDPDIQAETSKGTEGATRT